jgi:hypothetical protein
LITFGVFLLFSQLAGAAHAQNDFVGVNGVAVDQGMNGQQQDALSKFGQS